ncbi:MAG: choice-of-anchor U domain-containing protein [Acidimicrobiia bacterium]
MSEVDQKGGVVAGGDSHRERKASSFVTTLVGILFLLGSAAGALVLLNEGPASPTCPPGAITSYCTPYGNAGLAPNAAAIGTPAGGVVVVAPEGTTVSDATASPPSVPLPPNVQQLPVGVLGYTVSGIEPGGTIQVTIQLPPGTNANAYYKFDGTQWVDFTANATFSPNAVVLSLTDNGAGDSDQSLGVIVDPGGPVLVDNTPPTITCPQDMAFVLNQPNAKLTAGVTDAGVGVASPSVTVDVNATAVGAALNVPVTATDNGGNSATVQCAYAVHYKFTGFDPPVKSGVTKVEAGDELPLKWKLTDFANAPAGTAASFTGVVSAPADCGTYAPTGAFAADKLDGPLKFKAGDYKANWETKKAWRNTCRVVGVNLDDGTRHVAKVQLTK